MKKILAVLLIISVCGCAGGGFDKKRKISGPTYQIAMEKLNSRDMQAALVELKKAQKANPKDPEVYYGLALTYKLWNKPAEALDYVDKAIDYADYLKVEHPGMKSEAYNLKGDLLMMQRKNSEALKYFKKALEDDMYRTPEFTMYNIGIVYMTEGNLTEAKMYLEMTVSKDTNYAPAWDALGVVYSKMGNNDSSIKSLENAIAIYPDYIEAHWDIAQVFINEGNNEEAKKHLLEVMRLDTDGGFAIRAKEKLSEISVNQ
jgi:Tfp pilus assembly protein PilF